jgi:hypothetical protein
MRSSNAAGEGPAGGSPKKKPRPAAPAASEKKPAKAAATPRAASPRAASARRPGKKAASAAPAPAEPQMPDQDAIERMVAEAAYYLAEKRSFAPGFDEQDWQAALEQITAQLRSARNPLGPTVRS